MTDLVGNEIIIQRTNITTVFQRHITAFQDAHILPHDASEPELPPLLWRRIQRLEDFAPRAADALNIIRGLDFFNQRVLKELADGCMRHLADNRHAGLERHMDAFLQDSKLFRIAIKGRMRLRPPKLLDGKRQMARERTAKPFLIRRLPLFRMRIKQMPQGFVSHEDCSFWQTTKISYFEVMKI
ncbi:hypothetical protein [Selenomonas sp.]|uniref:hypothetical protein n=1 Tax=Selenomonas sp. TaxID=2053611 RepID=UPI002A75E830|nr:hypothetical protein [Selenomonas sp.]